MDDNWTKGLDSKTPRSDDKELEKSLWDEEPQVEKGSDAEDETEHVTGVFQRVAQKAMGQEKKPAMARPSSDHKPKPAEKQTQSVMPQNTQEFKEQFFSD